MASYRPFPPPPPSSFAAPPPPPPSQTSLPPPPYPQHNPYAQHPSFSGGGGSHPPSLPSNYSRNPPNPSSHHHGFAGPSHHFNPSRTQQQQQHSHRAPQHQPPPMPQQQYPYAPPPPPPSSSYPPPPPPPQPPQLPPPPPRPSVPSQQAPTMYYPSSQYSSQYNPSAPSAPPQPPPPSSPPPSHSLPRPSSLPPAPPMPPPTNQSLPLPPSHHPRASETAFSTRPRESSHAKPPPSVPPKQQNRPSAPPVAAGPSVGKTAHPVPLNGPSGRVETEEERRLRKKREYEKMKQEEKKQQMMKQVMRQTQATVLQKTQQLNPGSKPHGSMAGSRMAAERRTTPFLSGERVENRLKKPTTFLCKLKFRNELPDPTAQPKLLSMNTDKDRYTKYTITSLEKMHKPKLYPEPDLGIPLDLLDLNVYKTPEVCPPLAPEDEELLRDDDVATPVKQEGGIRIKDRPTDKGVAWLVKTQYISPLSMESAKLSLTEKQAKEIRETKEGRNLFLENLNNREKQIQAIEESFKAAKLPPVHQTNPELKPEKILPLLPDFERYNEQFVMVTFDGDPTADSEIYSKLDRSVRDEHEAQAIMKSFVVNGSDPSKPEKFLAYMVPAPDELSKDIDDENEDISYSWVREYHWDVRGDDADDPTTYLVNFDDDVARYLPLPTKLVLQKKKAKEGRSGDEIEHYPVPSRVSVRRTHPADREAKESGGTSSNHDKVNIMNSKRGRSLGEDDVEAWDKLQRVDDIDHYSGEEYMSE